MATLTLTSEMQALVDAAITALLPGFKLRTDYWQAVPKGTLELVYQIDSNYSSTPVISLAMLVKIQELFGAKDVQVSAEYDVDASDYENSRGGTGYDLDFSGSRMTITILL